MTTGTYLADSKSFKVADDWLRPANSHRLLQGSWTGTTEFVELPDYNEETVLRGGASSLGPLRVPRLARPAVAELEPLSEHCLRHEHCPLSGCDHPVENDPRAEHCPLAVQCLLPEACPLSVHDPRAVECHLRRRPSHRAGHQLMNRRLRERRKGCFLVANYPVHFLCTRSWQSADLDCAGESGTVAHAWLKRDPKRSPGASLAAPGRACLYCQITRTPSFARAKRGFKHVASPQMGAVRGWAEAPLGNISMSFQISD